jgi:hypothetical protein
MCNCTNTSERRDFRQGATILESAPLQGKGQSIPLFFAAIRNSLQNKSRKIIHMQDTGLAYKNSCFLGNGKPVLQVAKTGMERARLRRLGALL